MVGKDNSLVILAASSKGWRSLHHRTGPAVGGQSRLCERRVVCVGGLSGTCSCVVSMKADMWQIRQEWAGPGSV